MKPVVFLFTCFIFLLPTMAYASIAAPWSATSTNVGFISPNAINGNVPSLSFPSFTAISASLFSSIVSRLGIGTTSPYALLDIQGVSTGDDTPSLVIDGSGTANGNADLALTAATGGTSEANIDFNRVGATQWQLGIQNGGGATGNDFELWDGANNPVFTINHSSLDVNIGTTTCQGETEFCIWGDSGTSSAILQAVTSASTTALIALNNGSVGIGTSTPGTVFSIGTTGGINFDPTATSTFGSSANGVNINNGCYAINGTCLSTGGSSITGTQGQNVYIGAGGVAAATSTIFINTAGQVAIGTSTPYSLFSVGNPGKVGTTSLESDLTVGLSTTTPAFQVLGNITNAATGLEVIPAATGGTTLLQATDSGANSSINLAGKGTGSAILTSATTNVTATNSQLGGTVSGGSKFTITTASTQFNQAANGAAANTTYLFTGVANTNLTTTAEKKQFYINVGQSQSHASGAINTQRDVEITPTTQTFTAGTTVANSTIGSTTSVSIDGPPTQGPIANFTQAQALYIARGGVYTSSTTNATGLYIDAPLGAVNNEAAVFNGNTGIGTSTPTTAFVSVAASTTVGTVQDNYKGMVAIIGGLENGVTKLFFAIDQWGFPWSSGDQPTVSGGTSSLNAKATDASGHITVAGTLLTSVTVTFAHPKPSAPNCTMADSSTGVTAGISSITATQIVFSFSAGVNSGDIWYMCQGND